MTGAEEIKRNAGDTIKLQIDRMNMTLHRLNNREIYIDVRFANSAVGREVETLRRGIREQWLTVDSFKLAVFISELRSTLEKKRQNERLERMIRKRNALVDELDEIKTTTARVLQDQNEFTQLLNGLNVERSVLQDLIKSTYEDNNRNIIKYLNL